MQHRITLLCSVVAMLLGGAVGHAEPALEGPMPPVILQMPRLLTPVETAGTGLTPAISVRVTVSETGSVSQLEILSVTPSTRFDPLFVNAIQDSVGAWRFAPALEDGTPVERTLEWQLEFRPAAAESWAQVPDGPAPTSLVRDEEREHARLMKIYTLPLEQQREHLESLVTRAEVVLEPDSRRQLSDRGIVVVTDHPDAKSMEEAYRRHVMEF